MKKEDDVCFKKAIDLRRLGDFEASLEILYTLIDESPTHLEYYIVVGANLKKLGRQDIAIPYLKTAICLAPSDRIASLGFFHALWDVGLEEEALLEAVRFDQSNDTTEYVEILTAHLRGNFQGVDIRKEKSMLVGEQVARYPSAYRPPNPDDIDVDF